MAQAASHALTMWIGERYGDHFPMHFVCGFPRSGTTWFSELLADYLNLPRPRHYIFPIGFASVLQTHSEPESKIKNCFYIIRDGRDVMVSFYYYVMNLISNRSDHRSKKIAHDLGLKYEKTEIINNLPAFIEYIFNNPIGTKSNWSDGIVYVSWMVSSEIVGSVACWAGKSAITGLYVDHYEWIADMG